MFTWLWGHAGPLGLHYRSLWHMVYTSCQLGLLSVSICALVWTCFILWHFAFIHLIIPCPISEFCFAHTSTPALHKVSRLTGHTEIRSSSSVAFTKHRNTGDAEWLVLLVSQDLDKPCTTSCCKTYTRRYVNPQPDCSSTATDQLSITALSSWLVRWTC